MTAQPIIGVLGGSGLYDMEGLTQVSQVSQQTPFGSPSDKYLVGELGECKLIFLPRHGRGHRLLPSEINYRANIYGFKQLGVEWLISFSAVGSMREDIKPGDVVIVDQLFDRTKNRESSFFGYGIAGHIPFADPMCPHLSKVIYESAKEVGVMAHNGGTYICIEGPQFSTRAESRIYRSWGVDVIGMTNIPEAKLAREAGICYATVATCTDYDCWHETEEDVSVESVLQVLQNNVLVSRRILKSVVQKITKEHPCSCKYAVKNAIMTNPDAIDSETRKRLELILDGGE